MNRYHSLDALRGFAALAIVLFHFPVGNSGWWPVAGYLAVDVFFVMSGFILAGRYGAELEGGKLGVARFAWIRARRIGPMLLLSVLLGVGLHLAGMSKGPLMPDAGAMASLQAALLLPSLDPRRLAFPANIALWSLFVEFWVNVGWAGLLSVASRTRHGREFVAGVGKVSVVFFLLIALIAGTVDFGAAGGVASLALGFLRCAAGFSAGVWLVGKRSVVLLRITGRPLPWVIASAALVVWLPYLLQGTIVRGVGMWLSTAAVVAVWSAWQIRSRIADLIGEASYPIYALHVPLGVAYGALVGEDAMRTPAGLSGFVIAALLVSWCVARVPQMRKASPMPCLS